MTDEIAAGLRATYTRQAAAFDRQRNKSLFEKPWLDAFLAHVPPGGHVLDLGCGTAEPIAAYVLSKGYRITGIDAAEPMIALAQRRFPKENWQQGDIRSLPLPHPFDGILGWNSVFHLTVPEQRTLIPHLSAGLKPDAPLMLTVGHSEGEATGTVGTETVYHASLRPAEYKRLLANSACQIESMVIEDPDCRQHSVILAVKDQA